MPPAEMVAEKADKMIGLAVGGWLVMFGKKGEVDGVVRYEGPKGRTEHLVVDLKRGARYTVAGIAGGERTITASKEGVLRFTSEVGGSITLTPAE